MSTEHKLTIEDSLKDVGLSAQEFLTPIDADMPDLREGLAVRVTAPDTTDAILYIIPRISAANELQRFLVHATGQCRNCRRVTALKPHLELPASPYDTVVAGELLGEALTHGEPIHDCWHRGGDDADTHGAGQYL